MYNKLEYQFRFVLTSQWFPKTKEITLLQI